MSPADRFLCSWCVQRLLTRYPQYSTQRFFIMGESFAGHYLPNLAMKILTARTGPKINLFGMVRAAASLSICPLIFHAVRACLQGIGDGWISPIIQYKAYIDFALMNNLIDAKVSRVIHFSSCCCCISLL